MTTVTDPKPDPTLPSLVRRWALEHVVDRRIYLSGIPWRELKRIPADEITQAYLRNREEDTYDAVRVIPVAKVAWKYAGRFRKQTPLDVVIPCLAHPMPMALFDDPAMVKIDRRFVSLKLHGFRFEDGSAAWYFLGQCAECRTVYWADVDAD